MDFREEPSVRRVAVSEGDREILRLTVRPADRITTDRSAPRDYAGYSGADRLRGRLTLDYPGICPVDQCVVPAGVLRFAAASADRAGRG